MSGTFRTLPGYLLLAPDPDEVRKGLIWYSDNMAKKQQTGLVVFHEPLYLDECLENKRVLVEKWAWRKVHIEGIDFYVVDELSVYAVLEGHTAPIEAEGGQNGDTRRSAVGTEGEARGTVSRGSGTRPGRRHSAPRAGLGLV